MEKFIYAPEIAKLGHVALVSKDLEKSLWFFKQVVGLEEVEEVDGVHYLRAWGDFEHHTLSIEAGEESYIGHIGWKAKRREDVKQFAQLLEDAGTIVEWIASGTEKGQGESIRFRLPSEHVFEIYFDMEKTKANEESKSVLRNQTHKSWARGISPRRIDHVNIATSLDSRILTDFLTDRLGFKLREYLVAPDNTQLGGWMSVSNLVHDVAVMKINDADSTHEFHHISYWSDNGQDILRAADILSEQGIEFVGPGKHGISQALYLYVLDPGSGIRLELFSNGYLIFEPDWEPIEWTLEDKAIAFTYWGQQAGIPGKKEMTLPCGKSKTIQQT